MPAPLLVAADSPLWADALKAILRRAMPSVRVTTASLEQAGRANAPGAAVVVAQSCSPDALSAIWSLQLRGTRVVLLAPPETVADFTVAAVPDGVASDRGSVQAFLKVVQAVLAGKRHRPPEAPHGQGPPQKLSQRESQLLALLLRGMALKDAAEQLGVAYKTADAYRTALYSKLGVANRVQLILKVGRKGR